jgi:acyl-CoA synthetase (AMP-forming)/AMP-acid ligase II
MLYERWREIARTFSDEIALHDSGSGRQWTFRELAAAAETDGAPASGTAGFSRPIASGQKSAFQFPQGLSAEFIFTVLRGWRDEQIICPLEIEQSPPEIAPGLPPEIVHLKTTSATGGVARTVAFTASQLMADAENIVATMGLRRDWPNLGVISIAHSYGFSNLILPLLLHGIPLTLVGAPLPEIVKRAAAAEKFVTLAAVPALWRTWHETDSIPANVRLGISAGAPLPLTLEKKIFETRGLKVHNFYGSSECGGIAYDATTEPRTEASCVGAPMRNVELSVGDNGCLEVRSTAVAQTYWPEPGASLRDGVFRTSDLAEISNNLVYLRGRASDQINVAGRKVSPEAIEKILLTHPQVRECVVFGVADSSGERGESIVACVAGNGGVTAEPLRQFLLAKLPAWQIPREWWLVESLAANQRGKLSRADWRNRFLKRKT